MAIKLSRNQRFRALLIRTRWKKWLLPFVCSSPYLLSIAWLFSKGQIWIAQIMLAPVLMTFALALLSLGLARIEFRQK